MESLRLTFTNVHISILHGLPCRMESLRPTFTNEPSIFVDGDLAESIKRSASDRLGNFGAAGSRPDFSRVCHAMEFLGLCVETFFPRTILSYPGQPPPLNFFS